MIFSGKKIYNHNMAYGSSAVSISNIRIIFPNCFRNIQKCATFHDAFEIDGDALTLVAPEHDHGVDCM